MEIEGGPSQPSDGERVLDETELDPDIRTSGLRQADRDDQDADAVGGAVEHAVGGAEQYAVGNAVQYAVGDAVLCRSADGRAVRPCHAVLHMYACR